MFQLRIRPFNVPKEMLAGDNLWLEGMKLFGEEIRNHEWWKGKKPMWQKSLSDKSEVKNLFQRECKTLRMCLLMCQNFSLPNHMKTSASSN